MGSKIGPKALKNHLTFVNVNTVGAVSLRYGPMRVDLLLILLLKTEDDLHRDRVIASLNLSIFLQVD